MLFAMNLLSSLRFNKFFRSASLTKAINNEVMMMMMMMMGINLRAIAPGTDSPPFPFSRPEGKSPPLDELLFRCSNIREEREI